MRSVSRYTRILGSIHSSIFNSSNRFGNSLNMNNYRRYNFRRNMDYNYDDGYDGGFGMRNNIFFDENPFLSNSLMMDPPPPPPLTVNCGELRKRHQSKFVEMTGRFGKKRIGRFGELRDQYGATQLVILEEKYPRLARRFSNMPQDSVLTIMGQVVLRPINSRNQSMPTGDIEVEVAEIVNYEMPLNRNSLKRSYSTMAQGRTCGITSTEYKMAKSDNILKYFDNRNNTCNDLRHSDCGKEVTLVGWLPTLAGTKFRQLKDGYGQTQIIVEDEKCMETLQDVSMDSILLVKGRVVARPSSNINPKYETGDIEVYVNELKILDPNEPYDGPIKEKVPKMAIEKNSDDDDNQNKNGAPDKMQKIADTNKFTCRTHNCDELNISNVGEKVVICGWLEFARMNKFIVLRDGYGEIQVLISEAVSENCDINDISLESIVKVEGTVTPRPSNMQNPAMKTGEIEVQASNIEVLNAAKKNLPMEVRDFNRAKEVLRMEHRYIDLRFSDMQRNLRIRSSVLMKMREYLINYLGFVEVETPTLFRRTPGGAQEFVVPTRKPGHFYSLVQSPQQFKQMLMAGAIDRYFQVARCYRDEATRPDRQPEFTQLDIELSFTSRENVMKLVEETLLYCWPQKLEKITIPFPQITYDEAMSKYGTDKPDTRFELTLKDVTEILSKNEELTKGIDDFRAFVILVKKPNGILSNQTKKKLDDIAKNFNCKFTTSKCNKDSIKLWAEIGLGRLIKNDVAESLGKALSLEKDDLIFLAYGPKRQTQSLLGRIRLAFVESLEESNKIPKRKNNQYNFLWVVDFPLFTENEEAKQLESTHHPFTAAHPDDVEKLHKKEDLSKIRSQAYDLVLNGQEIAGGSIRIHNRDEQLLVLDEILKIEHTHLQHLLDALQSGCPPHGGIALGIDRLMAIICNTTSIRDVIAFPKGLDGKDHLSKAPVPISDDEKQLYFLDIIKVKSDNVEE